MTCHVALLAFPGCMASALTGFADVLNVANTLVDRGRRGGEPAFTWKLVAVSGGSIWSSAGIAFATVAFEPAAADVLFVPSIDHSRSSDLLGRLHQLTGERRLLRYWSITGKPLLASCSASFLLAEAGLLSGKAAATSWWLGKTFYERYPDVLLQVHELLVQDGELTTSGGVTSYADLALQLVRDVAGEAIAKAVARVMLLSETRDSQAPYVTPALIEETRRPVTQRALQWLEQNLDKAVDVEELAQICGVSSRTLLRHFRKDFGLTLIAYVQQQRIQRAKALLETTQQSFESICTNCGYQEVSTFRRLFKTHTSLSPAGYRQRFGMRQLPSLET